MQTRKLQHTHKKKNNTKKPTKNKNNKNNNWLKFLNQIKTNNKQINPVENSNTLGENTFNLFRMVKINLITFAKLHAVTRTLKDVFLGLFHKYNACKALQAAAQTSLYVAKDDFLRFSKTFNDCISIEHLLTALTFSHCRHSLHNLIMFHCYLTKLIHLNQILLSLFHCPMFCNFKLILGSCYVAFKRLNIIEVSLRFEKNVEKFV